MTRLNVFLVLIFAFSSICFGATLMQLSMERFKDSEAAKKDMTPYTLNDCATMAMEPLGKEKMAEEFYKKAFSLSFKGDWQAAETASKCASFIVNGSDHWDVEANDLIH